MARLLICFLLVTLSTPLTPTTAQAGTFLSRQLRAPRVRAALQTHGDRLREDFSRAGAAWPPRDLFLRAFKLEAALEVWAAPRAGTRRVRVWSIPLCALSGDLGPKRRRGDGQMPEGFYRVDRFNPWSSYHLSLGLNYPNLVDQARAAPGDPGDDIFVHGGCATIGCVTIEDEPIERVYLAAVMARDRGQRQLSMHVFPCRFGEARCEAALAESARDDARLESFWDSLRPGYLAFETRRQVPRVHATRTGYQLP